VKYCIIVPDGAADTPSPRLNDRTPLEAARTPNMDRAASDGLLGLVNNVPRRLSPGSAVAMMSVTGNDPLKYFTGRGPLEAADLGLRLEPGQWAVRCNLVTVADGRLADFTAGHISTAEADLLLRALQESLGSPEISFHTGTSYRHVLIYTGPDPLNAETTPPHDVVGQAVRECLPSGKGAPLLLDLMQRSRALLEAHDVNHVRVDLGKNPANMIWLWGQGVAPDLEPFEARFGVRGAVISAVNLVRGIGRLIGWEVVDVPGATGYVETDFAAKGRYAIDALTRCDLVLVHVEAPDEASHEGDVQAKVRSIERVDSHIVGPLMAHAADVPEGLRVLILPDHLTSVEDGRHKRGAVPFAMWGAGVKAASGCPYTEAHAAASDVEVDPGWQLMDQFIVPAP